MHTDHKATFRVCAPGVIRPIQLGDSGALLLSLLCFPIYHGPTQMLELFKVEKTAILPDLWKMSLPPPAVPKPLLCSDSCDWVLENKPIGVIKNVIIQWE